MMPLVSVLGCGTWLFLIEEQLYYIDLPPLTVGKHTLQFHAENTGAGFVLDVTYNLTVVPVSLQ